MTKKWTRIAFKGKVIPKYDKRSNLYQRGFVKIIKGKPCHIHQFRRGKSGKIFKQTNEPLFPSLK